MKEATPDMKLTLEVGQLVFSIAGRDHGHYYLVYCISEDGRRVWLVDGKKRDLKSPKAKNVCHLQKTNVIAKKFQEKVIHQQSVSAEEIREYLVELSIDQ